MGEGVGVVVGVGVGVGVWVGVDVGVSVAAAWVQATNASKSNEGSKCLYKALLILPTVIETESERKKVNVSAV